VSSEGPGGPGNQELTMRRFLISFASLVSLVPVVVCAQGRAGGAVHVGGGGGVHAAAAPHAAMHASAPSAGASHFIPGHYVRTPSGGLAFRAARPGNLYGYSAARTTNDGRRLLSQDVVPIVPSFGNGVSHFGPGRGGSRGPGRHFPFVAYFPFYGGGYWPLYDDGYDDTQSADQDQTQVAESAPPDYYNGYPPAPRPADTAEGLPEAAPVPSTDTVGRPSDEYVFVRRDGTLFFAVAYTWIDGNLRYVTSEGLRRSVAGDSLDLDATQQFNEQRGLTFRVPAA
jgi:hypothetical protein